MIHIYHFPVTVQKRQSKRLDHWRLQMTFSKTKMLIKTLKAQNNLTENGRTIDSWNSAPR